MSNNGIWVASHQCNLLPWVGFFAKMRESDKFLVETNDAYKVKEYANRVQFAGDWLTLSVHKPAKGATYSEVRIKDAATFFNKLRGKLNNIIKLSPDSSVTRVRFDKFVDAANEQLAKSDSLAQFNVAMIRFLAKEYDMDWKLHGIYTDYITGESTVDRVYRGLRPHLGTYLTGPALMDYSSEEDRTRLFPQGVDVITMNDNKLAGESMLYYYLLRPDLSLGGIFGEVGGYSIESA